MSNSDNSKDLDKYGVWVKNSPKDIKSESELSPENAIDDIDFLSDEDMFKDIEFPAAEESSDTAEASALPAETQAADIPDFPVEDTAAEDENGDTSLTPDELMNITANQDITAEEFPAEETSELSVDTNFEDFNIDDLDIDTEKTSAEDAVAEGPDKTEETAEEPAVEEALPDMAETKEVNLDDMPDGEISFDDFMSDATPSEPSHDTPAADASPDGDIDLSAFMDSDSGDGDIDLSAFMDESPAQQKEPSPEDIQDEKSLDIDVSFDDAASEIAKEDDSTETAAAPSAPAEETVSIPDLDDDMFNSIGSDSDKNKAGKPESAASAELSADTEEIDLSDFGFDDDDANIGMTARPDGEAAPKKEVVDYDIKVSADDDSKTHSVADVVNGNITEYMDATEDTETAETPDEPTAQPAGAIPEMSETGQEILRQIMGELSELKNEIKNIKTDFEAIKNRPSSAESDELPTEAENQPEENTGFFSGDDDEDDTIALSGSELNNILNSAEFSSEEAVPAEEKDREEPVFEENAFGDTAVETPVIEEKFSEEEPQADDIHTEETVAEEPVIGEISEPEIEETSVSDGDFKMDFSDSDLEEPQIDTTEVTPEDLTGTTDEFGEDNILPEEISVPKTEDDITVDSSSSDLMDSVKNTDEVEEPEINVDDILRENVSLKEGNEASVTLDKDINAAFDEADAAEADINDDALAEKEAYENSKAIEAATAEEKPLEEPLIDDFTLDDTAAEVPATLDDAGIDEASLTPEPMTGDGSADEIDLSIFDEPAVDEPAAEETAVTEEVSQDEIGEPVIEEPAVDDSVLDTIAEEPAVEEPVMEEESSEAPAIDDLAEEPVMEEPTVLDGPTVEEPVIEEESPTLSEETAVEESDVQSAIAEPLTPAENEAADTKNETSIPKNLKSEIVSVLTYMDQLLENLPEEKITEFAKSEHFVTYKKLFDELGLS